MSDSPIQRRDDLVIIDDDDLTLEIVRRKLRRLDLQVRYFEDEMEGLAYLEQNTPEVLIVDNRMPRMDGLELIRHLGEKNRLTSTRVYLCSSVELPSRMRSDAISLGAEVRLKDELEDVISWVSPGLATAQSET